MILALSQHHQVMFNQQVHHKETMVVQEVHLPLIMDLEVEVVLVVLEQMVHLLVEEMVVLGQQIL